MITVEDAEELMQRDIKKHDALKSILKTIEGLREWFNDATDEADEAVAWIVERLNEE